VRGLTHDERPRRGGESMKPIRTSALGAAVLLALSSVLLAACGSSSKAGPSGNVTPVTLEVAGPNPSISAQMVCGEAKEDIAQSAIGVDTVKPLAPKWSDHLYSCEYRYKGGAAMTLSVKEMSSVAETTAYFDSLGERLGRVQKLEGLGEGAFHTTNDSVVVRKDYRVLLVDVSHLPAQFGQPKMARVDVAISVATTIMGCWIGA
jgi:hypothetical protein